jgi:hypothetical protein
MKTSKNLVIAALALLAMTASVVAWKFYWKAALLEAASVGGDDATALRQQLAEAEKRRRVLEAREASRAEAKDEGAAVVAERGAGETPAAGGRGRGRGGPPSAEMQAAMERPEVQRLQALQQKAALDGRYGALFKTLNLGDEKLATFKTLLAEKEATMMDTMRAAREQGLDPRSDPEGFKKLVAATQAETNSAIRAAIGDTAFSQYEQYQATQPQRALVNQLQQSLSYTNAPLTSAQADQMVQVLAATTTAASAIGSAASGTPGAGMPSEGIEMGGRGGLMGGGGPGSGTSAVLITAATVTAAQTVLTTTQVQALQDLQALQVAQQQAQAILRAAGAGGPPAGGGRATGGG